MAECPQNKNVSTIKTNLVGTGIDEDVSSLLVSTLVSSNADNDQGSSAGNCHIESDNSKESLRIGMVNMKDDISHEVEVTVMTNFLQFSLEDDEYYHPEDMNAIDCNHIRILYFHH